MSRPPVTDDAATTVAIGETFDEPGVYPYTCMIHPGMTGAIVVGDAAAASTTGWSGAMADSTGGGAPADEAAAPDPGPAAAIGPQAGLAFLAVLLAAFGASVVVRRLRAPASAG